MKALPQKIFGAFQTNRTSLECLLLFSSRKAGTELRVSQSPFLCIGGQDSPEADVIVRVRRIVPVAIRRVAAIQDRGADTKQADPPNGGVSDPLVHSWVVQRVAQIFGLGRIPRMAGMEKMAPRFPNGQR